MDKNTISGIALIFIIFIFFSWWNSPSEEEQMNMDHKRDSIAQVIQIQRITDSIRNTVQMNSNNFQEQKIEVAENNQEEALTETTQDIKDKYGVFANSTIGEQKFIEIESDVLKLKFSNKGGRIYEAELKNFVTNDSLPLVLFKGDTARFGFVFNAANRLINTQDHYYKAFVNGHELGSQTKITISGDENVNIAYRLYADSAEGFNLDEYIEFSYTLTANDYMFDFDIHFQGLENIIDNRTGSVEFNWMQNLRTQEQIVDKYNGSGIYYKYSQDKVDNLSENKDGKESLKGRLAWISFKQRFFTSTLISKSQFLSANVEQIHLQSKDPKYQITMSTDVGLIVDNMKDYTVGMQMYLGPNEFRRLESYNMDLDHQIPIGWGFFLLAWINKYIVINVFHILGGLGWNYGIVILVLTILLKLFLFPIAYKTYLSSAKMRVLKPEIDVINEKFKDKDAVKKQQATMDLYKKAGVNPMAGCLPMLLQMPILFAMFRFFPASIELRQKAFLWAHDLSTYDSIWTFPNGFDIPFYGDHISLFTLLMTVSTIMYTKVNNDMMGSSTQQMPGMKYMMYLMPVMFLGIFNNYAAGLSYYYFLANIITFGQMFLIRKTIDEKKIHAQLQANKLKPAKKKSGFQKRLEEMSKQQQQGKKK
ncbi:MAG: membrane protein insertase YidC [Bacteroidales bacterium]|nr:membrane protein insertase YidC [Bacteroidales bacterium]